MAGGFRANVFDPILVVCQIVAMQCFFYVSLGAWLVVANFVAGITYSVDQFFDYHVSLAHVLTCCLAKFTDKLILKALVMFYSFSNGHGKFAPLC